MRSSSVFPDFCCVFPTTGNFRLLTGVLGTERHSWCNACSMAIQGTVVTQVRHFLILTRGQQQPGGTACWADGHLGPMQNVKWPSPASGTSCLWPPMIGHYVLSSQMGTWLKRIKEPTYMPAVHYWQRDPTQGGDESPQSWELFHP